jgi:type IV secretory pathway TraG/TraD family ATPase VirD4
VIPDPVPVVIPAACAGLAAAVYWLLPPHHHNTAEGGWAGRGDLAALAARRAEPGRVTLGRVGRRWLAARPRESILVLGPTQSGKTTSLAAPALRDWPGPAVGTSVKRDLVELTSSRPRPTWTFDPTSTSSATWSPLGGCRSWRRAQQVASWLVGAARPPGTDRDAFWYQSASKLLAPVLLAAALEGADMAWVVQTVDARRFKAVHEALDHPTEQPAQAAMMAVLGRDERQVSSVVATLETTLQCFSDPLVAAATSSSQFTPARLFAEGGTLHVVAPLHEQERLAPLFTALVRTILAEAYESQRPPPPGLLVVLDELCNIAPIEDLPQVASTCAGVGVQLVSVVQDLAQLEHRYGPARSRTIVSNHACVVALAGCKDLGTLRLLSDLVGDHEVERVTRHHDGKRSTAPERRRLAPVEQLRLLPRGSALLLAGSDRPVRLKLMKGGGGRSN